MEKWCDCGTNLVDPRLNRAADPDRPVSGVGGHCVALVVALRVVAPIVDLNEGHDRAGRAILRDEIDDFLRKGIPIGRVALSDQAGWGLQKGAHGDLSVYPATRKRSLKCHHHCCLTIGKEPLSHWPWSTEYTLSGAQGLQEQDYAYERYNGCEWMIHGSPGSL